MYTEMLPHYAECKDTDIQTCHTGVHLECSCTEPHKCQLSGNCKKGKKKYNKGGSVEVDCNTHATCSKLMTISLELYLILRHIWLYEIEHS